MAHWATAGIVAWAEGLTGRAPSRADGAAPWATDGVEGAERAGRSDVSIASKRPAMATVT